MTEPTSASSAPASPDPKKKNEKKADAKSLPIITPIGDDKASNIFWVDDSEKGRKSAHKGMALKNKPHQLNEKEYARRSLEEWGTLIGAKKITMTNIPAEDQKTIKDAADKERKRITGKAPMFTAGELAALKGKAAIGPDGTLIEWDGVTALAPAS